MRIRKHTDGRIAVERVDHAWSVHDGSDPVWPAVFTAHSDDVIGDGWVELYMVVLPEPDQIGEASTKRWFTFGDSGSRMTVYANGIQFQTPGGGEATYGPDKVEALRDATLKTLAAIAAYDEFGRHARRYPEPQPPAATKPALDIECFCDGVAHPLGEGPTCGKGRWS